jgi:translation elongation factor EF-Ts
MASVSKVEYIRDKTGYPLDYIVKALDACDDDLKVALEYLRVRGLPLASIYTELEQAYLNVYGKIPAKK